MIIVAQKSTGWNQSKLHILLLNRSTFTFWLGFCHPQHLELFGAEPPCSSLVVYSVLIIIATISELSIAVCTFYRSVHLLLQCAPVG